MFGLFRKKTPSEKLNKKYRKLMEDHYTLSKVNRILADEKYAEATALLKEIEKLEAEGS